MDKENILYYQSNIKTSRDEDSVYAMKYANQQMLIDKLQQENKKYKEAIDKAIEFTNKKWGTWCTHHLEYMTELQNILKEVSE